MRPAILLGAAAAITAALAFDSVCVVHQAQLGMILRFGRPVRVEAAPGLYTKWPLAETVVRFDARSQAVEANQVQVAATGGGQLILDAVLHYRVEDPRRFYLALGDLRAADERLRDLLGSSVRRTLGGLETAGGTGAPEADDPGRRVEATVEDLRRRIAAAGLGVAVVDVSLRHVEPTAAEAEAIYRRMRTEGAQQAAQLRADGEQRKAEIAADADRQVAAIRGDAEAQALKINGEGDAQRIAVLGVAYGKDPAFARFFRQMEAYQNALAQGDTTLVLSPDNAFLHDFAKGPGGK